MTGSCHKRAIGVARPILRSSTFLAGTTVLLIVMAPDTASAACTIAGSPAGSGIVQVPDGSAIDCSGVTDNISLQGQAPSSGGTPQGTDFILRPGSQITSNMPPPGGGTILAPPALSVLGGSQVVVDSSTMLATDIGREAIVFSGAANGGRIEIGNGAIVEATEEALTGTRGRADGWTIVNDGVISTIGRGGDATVRTGDNATFTNNGTVRRRTNTGQVPTTRTGVTGIAAGSGSTITNEASGRILVNVEASQTQTVATAVQLSGANVSLVNSGEILHERGNGKGSAISFFSVDGGSVTNNDGGVIDARLAAVAVRGSLAGASTTFTNSGLLLGNRSGEGAVRLTGEDFIFVQTETGRIDGDVRVYVVDRQSGLSNHPNKATLRFEGGAGNTSYTQSPALTTFFGFSDIEVIGDTRVVLSQEFSLGQTGSTIGANPGGNFADTLTFNVADTNGVLELGGNISGSSSQFAKDGLGTLRLTGNSTSTGVMSVREGTLDIDGGSYAGSVGLSAGTSLLGRGTIGHGLIIANGARVAADGRAGSVLSVENMLTAPGAILEYELEDSGGSLTTDRIDVTNKASFRSGTIVDVFFSPNAQLPALTGINILTAGNGLRGIAPTPRFDPANLPAGQNYHLNLEAANIGTGFATPGNPIPTGSGLGVVTLQIENFGAAPPKANAQFTVINAPYLVPTLPPVLTPPQQPVLVPGQVPTLAPTLIKGPTAQVTVPVVTGQPNTGITIIGGGAQVGGTVTPQSPNPNQVPVGTPTNLVTVQPPTGMGTNVVGVTGTYTGVNQTSAKSGTTNRLVYKPNQVTNHLTPTNYGNLAPIGVTQTKTQQQVGQAITSSLPQPNARPTDQGQASLVAGLYPLSLGQINSALDSVAGVGTDPTFVTVLNNRLIQDAIEARLVGRRTGADPSSAVDFAAAIGGSDGLAASTRDGTSFFGTGAGDDGRAVWGQLIGGFAEGEPYLRDADLTTAGFVAGVDRALSPGMVVGAALGYANTRIDPGPGGQDRVSTLEAAAYGSWFDDGWFGNGIVGLGYNWLDMDRAVVVGAQRDTASASANAGSFFAGISGGRTFATGFGGIEPTAGLRYDHVRRDGFTEDGAGAYDRDVSEETLNSARTYIGVRAFGDFSEADGKGWRPELRIGWGREIGDSDIDGTASLVDAPGASFSVLTPGPGENAAILGMRLAGKGLTSAYYFDYQADVRQDYVGQTVRAGLNLRF